MKNLGTLDIDVSNEKLYEKYYSFDDIFFKKEPCYDFALKKISDLAGKIDSLQLTTYRKTILSKAINESTAKSNEEGSFKLSPLVAYEIGKLSDEEVARYLFYRYRYEVFPKTKEIDHYPPCVQIEPSSVCNYRCIFCYQRHPFFSKPDNLGTMRIETFKKIIDEIEGNVEAVTLASRGEPLISPDICEMLKYCTNKFLAFKLNTNAYFLDEIKSNAILESGLNTLVLSVDSIDPPLYSKFRVKGDLEKVTGNIKLFSRIRERNYRDSNIIVRVSGVHFSEAQSFSSMIDYWKDFVDQISFVKYNPWENVYEKSVNSVNEPCSDLWRRMFTWFDGKANPCDVDFESHLTPGDIIGNTVSDIWRSDKYTRLREKHLNGCRTKSSPCNRCVLV